MDKKQQEIQKALDGIIDEHLGEIEEAAEKVATNIFAHGIPPQQAMNISPQKLEGIYAQGYQLFNSGNYKKALKTFQLLCTLAWHDPRFYMAAGACLHKLKKYKKAVECYTRSATIDQDNPIPFYHAVDCCLETNDILSASIFLEMVITRCGDKEEYSVVKERCTIMQKSLIDEMNEKGLRVPINLPEAGGKNE